MAQRVGRGITLLFHDRDTRRGEWSAARPGRTLPPGKSGTHFTGGWMGPRAGLDGRKVSSPRIRKMVIMLIKITMEKEVE